jgi:hypothetical protein
LAIAALFLMWPAVSRADLISLGYLSWDVLIPGAPGSPGVNTFTIGNLTGDSAIGGNDLPPTFPVLTPVTFQNSSLSFIVDGTPQTVLLGDIGPGFDNSPLLDFSDTLQFSSALFSATIDSQILALDGGGYFTTSSDQITALLLPSDGIALIAGTDFQLIDEVSATFEAQAFNALNRTNLDLPQLYVDQPATFGHIFSAKPARQIQFALHFDY